MRSLLVAVLAFYASVLTWGWLVNSKLNQVRYAVFYKLPGVQKNNTSSAWLWFDQVRLSGDSEHTGSGTFDPTSLGIKLLGIIKLKMAGAAIFSIKSEIKVVGLNELVTGTIKLVQLGQDKAVLSDGTQNAVVLLESDSQLSLLGDSSSYSPANDSLSQSAENQPVGIIAAAADPKIRDKLQQLRQDIQQSPLKAAEMVVFNPVSNQGKIDGIEVSPKSDPALFQSLGFSNKDVILAVNNLPIDRLMQSPDEWPKLLRADKLTFRIKRNNQIINHQFAW